MREIDLAGAGLQRPFVTASPGVLPGLAALVTPGPAQLVRLSIQHGVQRLFNRPAQAQELKEVVAEQALELRLLKKA